MENIIMKLIPRKGKRPVMINFYDQFKLSYGHIEADWDKPLMELHYTNELWTLVTENSNEVEPFIWSTDLNKIMAALYPILLPEFKKIVKDWIMEELEIKITLLELSV